MSGVIYLKREAGFTLVEILVAMVLLTFVLMGSFLLALNYRGLLIAAETRTAAINFAENILEDYRHRAFNNIVDQPTQSINSITRNVDGRNIRVSYSFSVAVANFQHVINQNGSVTITQTNNAAATTLRRVTVTVNYNVADARRIRNDNSVQLFALIPRN